MRRQPTEQGKEIPIIASASINLIKTFPGTNSRTTVHSSFLFLLSVSGPSFYISPQLLSFLFVPTLFFLPSLILCLGNAIYIFIFIKWILILPFSLMSPGNLFALQSLGTTESYYPTGRLLLCTDPRPTNRHTQSRPLMLKT